jgi:hypothetical protein
MEMAQKNRREEERLNSTIRANMLYWHGDMAFEKAHLSNRRRSYYLNLKPVRNVM